MKVYFIYAEGDTVQYDLGNHRHNILLFNHVF